jgi:DNA-binding transcriptional regulator YhcF (GntR family)
VTGDPLIISEARRATVTEAMRGWLSEAYSLGITKEELLEFISKEEI